MPALVPILLILSRETPDRLSHHVDLRPIFRYNSYNVPDFAVGLNQTKEVVGMASDTEKAARRMTCWNCRRYSRADRLCMEGKANPKRKSDSFAVAESLGLRTLCHYNPYRDGLAMRMFFPTAPATIRMAAQRRRSRPRRLLLEVITAETTAVDKAESGLARGTE